MNKTDLQKLEENLMRLEKPALNYDQRARMKASIMQSLDEPEYVPSKLLHFINRIQEVALLVRPSAVLRTRVKERVYARIDTSSRSLFSFPWVKAMSSALVFVLTLSSFFFFAFEANVTEAHGLTRIANVSGEVFVIRSSKELPAKSGMVLLEDDLVKTTSGSATIIYHDDSVTRLSNNTHLNINKLSMDDIHTEVEVFVEKGHVWANVPSLAGSDSVFDVGFADYSAQVSNKATFNVEVKEDKAVELEVYESVVYVESNSEEIKPVINGYKVEVGAVAEDVALLPLEEADKEGDWVKENINEDEKYVQSVATKVIDEAKLDLETKTVSADATLSQRIEALNADLFEYEVLLSEANTRAAASKLVEIKSLIEQLIAEIELLEDKAEAERLRNNLNRALSLHKKNLTLITPNNVDTSEAKELIYDLKANLATSEDAKKEVEMERAQDVLLDTVEDLDESQNLDLAHINEEVLDKKNAQLLAVLKQAQDREITENTTEPKKNSLGESVENSEERVEEESKSESAVTTPPVDRTKLEATPSATKVVTPNSSGETKEQILPPQFNLNFQR